MSTTLEKPKRVQKKIKSVGNLSHTPNYINLMTPGDIVSEKMFEMGINAVELAKRMNVSVKTVEQLLNAEIPLTQTLAEKIENVTWMPASFMLRVEKSYREKCIFATEHPEIPAYRGTEIVNQPENKK
jgi:plasmid maintenance system antidote protein VapI